MIRTQPIVFSPIDPHLLFFAANTLWKTRDGGRNWKQISPDLTRKTYELPASIGKYRNATDGAADTTRRDLCRGAVAAGYESHLGGTDDGLIHLTTDGGENWTDVTPPQISAVAENFDHRRQPLRREHRLRGGEHVAAR